MLHGYPLVALAPLAGLAVDVLVHVTMSRLLDGRRIALAVLSGIAAGLAATLVLSAWGLAQMASAAGDVAALAIFDAITYLALAYGYFNFVNLNMTALRIRLLLELLEAPDGITRSDLRRIYDADELTRRRIDRLLIQRHIIECDGRYRCGASGLLSLARTITALKWIVLGHGNRTLDAALEREARPAPPPPSRET